MIHNLEGMTDDWCQRVYQYRRDEANQLAVELEKRGYKGEYITPDSRRGDLNPTTRPTQFEWSKP